MTPDDGDMADRKRAIFQGLSPRRRKFIEKIGYDAWDPFQEPKEPLDLRRDASDRTPRRLVDAFLAAHPDASDAFAKGAWEMCMGLMTASERHRGMDAFCRWYGALLAHEGTSAGDGPHGEKP